jgi:CRP-like cAMP-binding protein
MNMESGDYSRLRAVMERLVVFSDLEWKMLLPMLRYKELAKGSLWISEQQRERYVGFILEGNMRHYYTRDGEEKTTYFYFENNLVSAYFSAISGKPSRFSIEALTDCSLHVFPYSHLEQLYRTSATWERFGRLLAEYIATGLEDRMTELLMLSPEERYASLLRGNKDKIIERIPQHYIANYLGITPVSLSRIRKRMMTKQA